VGALVTQIRELLIDIDRLHAPAGSCALNWGVCPDHGRTLTTRDGRSRCTVCGTTWDHNREDQPCREPAVSRHGSTPICAGHALAAPPARG
jgi:hypothetical protein